MGLFLFHHFEESGFEVTAYDPNPERAGLIQSLQSGYRHGGDVDVFIFALFPAQIEQDPAILDSNAQLVNISSVQQPGIKRLIKGGAKKSEILSFHPLFGPVGVSKSGWTGKQIIVTTQPKNDARADAILETFTRKGVIIDQMSPEEHDSKMLPHALAFLIAELVKVGARGADPRFLTGSGRQMLGLLDFTEAGSEELRNLILSNPGLKEVVPKLRQVLEELSKRHGW